MLNLLLFILFSIGLTNVLVNASILERTREIVERENEFFGNMLRCMLCTGFWVGLFSANFFGFSMLLGAAIGSLAGDFYSTIVEAIETWTIKNTEELLEDE